MGPDPDESSHTGGSLPPYEPSHPPFQSDVVMDDYISQPSGYMSLPFSQGSADVHPHHPVNNSQSNIQHHFATHVLSNLAFISDGSTPHFTQYPSQLPPNHYLWPAAVEDSAASNNDEGSSVNAIHHALNAMSQPQTMTESMSYPILGDPAEGDVLAEFQTASPSAYLAQFPHHQPLPQPAVPSPQAISLDAGSWPTTVPNPNPGPVPSAPSPPGHSINQTGTVTYQLQNHIQSLEALQQQDGDSDSEGPGPGDEIEPPAIPSPPLPPPPPPPPPPQQQQVPIHLLNFSLPNPNSLGPENPQLLLFLRRWIHDPRVHPVPLSREVDAQAEESERVVHLGNLEGDKCDMQGINWQQMGTSRRLARAQRLITYGNYVNCAHSDAWNPPYELPSDADFFRFRRMDIKHNVHLAHFQLRNVLSCVSRSLAFYPSVRSVHQINPVSGKGTIALDLRKISNLQVSTLSAKYGTLVAGGFNGDYYVKSLDSIQERERGYHEGQLTMNMSGITNHVQLCHGRGSDRPLASFASNDLGFRTLDLETDKTISKATFDFPINCSAISPDRRLRVMVGDDNHVLICNSETNEVLQKLKSHTDFGFACDWSQNGWSVATGFQDMMVNIWDARKWTNSEGRATPVTTIKTNMAGARSLRFSPLGSGQPVLVAAEEADFINIIDAELFDQRQCLDIFGEIGGVDFVNDGRDLMVLCCDRHRGGLLRLERTKHSDFYDINTPPGLSLEEYERGRERRTRTLYNRRRLRAACPADLDFF